VAPPSAAWMDAMLDRVRVGAGEAGACRGWSARDSVLSAAPSICRQQLCRSVGSRPFALCSQLRLLEPAQKMRKRRGNAQTPHTVSRTQNTRTHTHAQAHTGTVPMRRAGGCHVSTLARALHSTASLHHAPTHGWLDAVLAHLHTRMDEMQVGWWWCRRCCSC